MRHLRYIILGLVLVQLWGCERMFINEKPATDNAAVFDHLWNTVDKKYSFFEDKNIDWDSVRSIYRPKALASKNSLQLFDVLANTLFTLRDGHVNLYGGFDLSRNWQWYLDYPENFDFSIIERNYLDSSADYQISGSLYNGIVDSVGYMYYGSFGSDVSTSLLNYLMLKFLDKRVNREGIKVKGIIIDVRNNGGGAVSNAFTFADRFAGEKKLVAKWYYKDGPGHNDFSAPEDKYVEFKGDKDYKVDVPVVVLTNRSCYSACNMFVSIMSQLPNVTIIGDRTGGGGGLPMNDELPNGWTYRFSTTKTIDAQGRNIEFGVEPDIKVDMDPADQAKGKDTIIEAAIQFIKDQQ